MAQTYTAGFGSPQGAAVSVPAPAVVQKPEVAEASIDAPAKLASPSVGVQISAQVNPAVVVAAPEVAAPDPAKPRNPNAETVPQNDADNGNTAASAPGATAANSVDLSPDVASAVNETAAPAVSQEQAVVKDAQAAVEKAQAEAERQEVQALKARDQEVRRHEQAHASAGGVYAGAPQYDFTTGPDGGRYAIGGEVSIDTAPVPGDPQATLEKAQTVRRAALAPAEPSEQDRRVAAEASQMAAQARVELLQLQRSEEDEATSREASAAADPAQVAQNVEASQAAQAQAAEERAAKAEAEQEAEQETAAESDEASTRPALLYSDEGGEDESEVDAAASDVSARERFEQIYGNVSSVAQQLTAIADWTAAQPAMENLLDDII